MISQLSLPTWFMSLSAADTRWTDLLRMLATLNDGFDYLRFGNIRENLIFANIPEFVASQIQSSR